MKNKIFIVSTTSTFFNFFKGQLSYLSSFFDITLVSKDVDRTLKSIADRENVKYKEISIEREISLFRDIKTLISLIALFNKEKPDMVWGNTPKGSLLAVVAAYISGVRVRQYMCHGLRYQSERGLKRKVLIMMEKITCKLATQVVCVSFGVRDQLLKDKIVNDKKTLVIGNGSCNGIDTDFFNNNLVSNDDVCELKNKLHLDKDSFVFTFVGRIVQDKGVHELLTAFNQVKKQFKNSRLLVIGKIEEHNKISPEAMDVLMNNSHIHYLGQQSNIRLFLAVSNTLILPSYREGFGMVLLEALSMDIPIIASNIIGCNDIVEPNVNGLFCNKKDVQSLIYAMSQIVENESLRASLQRNARLSIVEKYKKETVWDNYLEFYKSILKTNVQ